MRDDYTLTVPGWTVGGGVEWAFAGNWTAFAEYNFLDFGTPRVTFTPTASGPTFRSISSRTSTASWWASLRMSGSKR